MTWSSTETIIGMSRVAHPISIHDDLSWVFSSTLSHPESRP